MSPQIDPTGRGQQSLSWLIALSRAINQTHDRLEILNHLCRAVVEALAVNHSGILLFDDSFTEGTVAAEHPSDFGAMDGGAIPLADSPAEAKLIHKQETLAFEDLTSRFAAEELGVVCEILARRGIRAVLFVPIVIRDRVVGSFSLDQTDGPRVFTADEKAICQLLSSIAAGALDKAGWVATAAMGATRLTHAVANLGAPGHDKEPERHIVTLARELVEAESGTFFYWLPKQRRLAKAATVNESPEQARHADSGGSAFPGEPDDNDRFDAIIHGPDRVVRFPAAPGRGQSIGVVIGEPGAPEGIILLQAPQGRGFSNDQLSCLQIFGQHAGNSLIFARDVRRIQFFQELGEKGLGNDSVQEVTRVHLQLTRQYLNATFCRMALWDDQENLWLDECWNDSDEGRRMHTLDGNRRMLQTLDSLGTRERECTREDAQYAPLLDSLSLDTGSRTTAEWASLTALTRERRTVGWFVVAMPRAELPVSVMHQMRSTIAQVARRLSTILSRLSLQGLSERRATLLRLFHEVSSEPLEAMPMKELRHEIPRLAVRLLGASAAGLFEVLPEAGLLSLRGCSEVGGFGEIESLSLGPLAARILRIGRAEAISASSLTADQDPGWQALLNAWPTVAMAPVKVAGPDFNYALLIAFREPRKLQAAAELDFLNSFAARASSSLSGAALTQATAAGDRGSLVHTRTLYELALFALGERDPRKILAAVLTGVTAEYGLRMNRAAILLLARTGVVFELVGEEAIGAIEKPDAEKGWDTYRGSSLQTFSNYLEAARKGLVISTKLRSRIAAARIPVGDEACRDFHRVLMESKGEVIAPEGLPASLAEAYAPGGAPVAVVPLRTVDGVLHGVLLADNKHTELPIDDSTCDLLMQFAGVATEVCARRERSAAPQWGVIDVDINGSPQQILEAMLDEIRLPYRGSGAGVILIDEQKRARDLLTRGMERPADPASWMRPNGYSRQVIDSALPVFLEDRQALAARVNPNIPIASFPSSVCVPFIKDRSPLGIVWLYFAEKQSKEFEQERLPDLTRLVKRFTTAYRTALTLERRTAMIRLSQELSV